MLSKKNKIIAGTVAAVLVVAGGAFAIVKSNSSDLKLKEEAIEVEYGKAVSTKAEDYLDLSKVEDKEAYLKDVTVTKDTKLEKGKKYEALGDYEVVIKDKEDEATVKVTVKDTTKPKFNKVDKIETFKGEKVNYKKFVKAKDLQKVTLSFDDKEVKLSKTGNYLLKVTATDASDNKAEKVIAGLVVAGGAFAIVKSNSSDLKLKDKEVEVEYGKAVSTNPEDYLDLEKVKDKEAYLKDVTVIKDTKLEKGKKYEALGDYEVVIKDKEDEATVKVTVKDTTKPKFNKVDKIETFKGEKINYKKFIKAKDLQKVKLAFDDKEVKLSKTGKYVLKVTATDLSDNKAEKEIKVIVKAKPKTNSNEKIETVVDKKGNVVSKVVDKDSSSSSSTNVNRPSKVIVKAKPKTNSNEKIETVVDKKGNVVSKVVDKDSSSSSSTNVNRPSSKPSRPSYNKPSSNNGSGSSTNVNRPSNKPSKPHKPSKPSKPSKPAVCKHPGCHPAYGGFTYSDCSSTNVNRPSNKPSKPHKPSKPSKPSKPAVCKHPGCHPAYGGFTYSDSQIEDWAFAYFEKVGSGGTYGVAWCPECDKMYISYFN